MYEAHRCALRANYRTRTISCYSRQHWLSTLSLRWPTSRCQSIFPPLKKFPVFFVEFASGWQHWFELRVTMIFLSLSRPTYTRLSSLLPLFRFSSTLPSRVLYQVTITPPPHPSSPQIVDAPHPKGSWLWAGWQYSPIGKWLTQSCRSPDWTWWRIALSTGSPGFGHRFFDFRFLCRQSKEC